MKPKILIADDNGHLLSALREQMGARYDVITCADAYMALQLAMKEKPDVMVLDIRMPAGEGFSVIERLASDPVLKGIPVIYITGDQSTLLKLRAEKLGAFGLLYKPIRLSTLLATINSAVNTRRGGNSGPGDTARVA